MSRTKTIKISSDCKVVSYVKDMGVPCQIKRAIDMALEKKPKYNWGLYKNGKNIFVRIGNNAFFRVEVVGEKIPTMDLKIVLSYLLNHNGLGGLNQLCIAEDCPLKDIPACTMKLLSKAIS